MILPNKYGRKLGRERKRWRMGLEIVGGGKEEEEEGRKSLKRDAAAAVRKWWEAEVVGGRMFKAVSKKFEMRCQFYLCCQ